MHPYRTPPPPRDDDDRESSPPAEERVLAWALVVVGGLRVAIAVARSESFGAEATIAAILLVLGLVFVLRPRRDAGS